jgi:hypothetical protein
MASLKVEHSALVEFGRFKVLDIGLRRILCGKYAEMLNKVYFPLRMHKFC